MARLACAARRGASSSGSNPKAPTRPRALTSSTRPPKLRTRSTRLSSTRVAAANGMAESLMIRARRSVTRRRSQVHDRPEDSTGTVNADHDPHGARAGRLAVVATPASGKGAALRGEIREVSVVMADLRGFTEFCERVPPDRMHRVLNEYLTAMIDVILGQQGHVQDFIGDGILGVFGAPVQDLDHGWHAALSAVEMQVAIRRLGRRWRREEGTPFGLGVAVHTGLAFAGEVGSPRHRKYAVVGDPVNTVARLEELNRNLGTEIVMSGDALALVRDWVDVLPRGSFAVRGRSHTVEVFELLGVDTPGRGHQHSPVPVSGDIDSIAVSHGQLPWIRSSGTSTRLTPLKLNRSSTL
jgi:class 3 adenylate cyclase